MPRPTHRNALAIAAAAVVLSVPVFARAADDPNPAPPPAAAAPSGDTLAGARKWIAEKKWAEALAELKRVNATGSADWNNLMGYSHRKARAPDLAAAERYYTAALRIEPRHRGALEYAGELALMQGNLPLAEQRAAALQQACGGNCPELADLKDAVARYKANGNRHVERD